VIFRAFRPFTELKLFKSIWKNLAPGGALFAYKGKQFNAKMEMAALATDPLLAGPFRERRSSRSGFHSSMRNAASS